MIDSKEAFIDKGAILSSSLCARKERVPLADASKEERTNLKPSGRSWLGTLKTPALLVLGGLIIKLVDFKLISIVIDWKNPVHLRIIAILSIALAAGMFVWALHSRDRIATEASKGKELGDRLADIQSKLGENVEKAALLLQIDGLKQELSALKRRTYQFLEFEGVSLLSLFAYLDESVETYVNPVSLECWTMSLKLASEHVGYADVSVTYELRGKNLSDKPLIHLQLRISGDSPAKKEDLQLKLVDGKTFRNLGVHVVNDRARTKVVDLEFPAPGIEPNHDFDVKFTYSWPRSFQLPKDYWYLDNVNFQGATKEINIVVDFEPMSVLQASVYSISRVGDSLTPCGSAVFQDNSPGKVSFSTRNAEKDAFYLMLIECEQPSKERALKA